MVGIIQAVAKWNGHDSSILLATGGNGVKAFTDMQLGHQLWLCGSEVPGQQRPPMAPEVLLSELPPDPSKSWPLAALATYQQQVQAIKDLCQRHRGEVREISGEWTQIDRPFPEPATGGIHFFHAQFCLSAERARGAHTPTASPGFPGTHRYSETGRDPMSSVGERIPRVPLYENRSGRAD